MVQQCTVKIKRFGTRGKCFALPQKRTDSDSGGKGLKRGHQRSELSLWSVTKSHICKAGASSLQTIQSKNLIVIQLQNSLSNCNEINLVLGVKYSSGHVDSNTVTDFEI